jgi:hypothetical protein
MECKGCEEISFLFEEDNKLTDADESETLPFEASEDSTTFPPRLFRRLPPWVPSIPDDELQELLREVYGALQNGSRRLAVMGVRAMLDRVITKAVGDKGPFFKRLKSYVEHGRLGLRTEDAINAVFNVGSAAAHRAFRPSQEQIIDAIDALEHILHEAYVLPQRTLRLEDGTPPKPNFGPRRR